MQKRKLKFNTGETLAEVIMSLALFAMIGGAVALLIAGSFRGTLVGGTQTQALAYERESWEGLESIGRIAYGQLQSGTYGMTHASGTWALTDFPDVNGIFTRTITISDVYRDASGNISTTGTKDINTRKIIINISWTIAGRSKNISVIDYFTNWDSLDVTQKQGSFGGGLFATTKLSPLSATSTPTSSPQLTTANSLFWKCALVQGVVDTGTGVGNAITTFNYPAGGKYAFMADSGGNFIVFDKSNTKNPTQIALVPTDGSAGLSIAISPDGKYGYMGTAKGSFVAINLLPLLSSPLGSTSTIAVTATLSMLTNGQDINKIILSADGKTAYIATNKGTGANANLDFYTINLNSPANPAFFVGGNSGKGLFGPDGKSLALSKDGKYVFFVADGGTLTKQLMVINVGTSTSPSLVTNINLSTSNGISTTTANAPADVAIYITPNGATSTLYIVTANSAGTSGEFFEADVSSSTKPKQTYNINLGNGANAVTAEGTNAIVGTPTANGNTLQVVDTAPVEIEPDGTVVPLTDQTPVIVLNINLSKQSYNGIFWDATDKLLYAATKDTSGQFAIVNRSGKINWGCMQREAVIGLPSKNPSLGGLSVFSSGNNLFFGTAVSSKNPEFYVYDVTDPSSPIQPKPGTAEISASVSGIFVSNNFAFLATNDSSAQIKVLNIASSSLPFPAPGGTYTPGNNSAATAIAVDHSTVLAAIGTVLYKLNADANGALTYLAQTPLSGIASKIIFYGDGNYAYVATANNSNQVQVVNYSSGLSVKNSISLPSGSANGLWLKGKWLLVGTTGGAGSDNFIVYDVSGPGAPSSGTGIPASVLASMNLGSKVTAIAASPDENFAFAGVNINGQEMKTIDLGGLLSTTTPPFIAASSTETTLNGFINDMYFSKDNNTIFVADQNNTEGGYIYGEIRGFAGFNTQYATNGTYTEFPLTDAGQNVNWNNISWTYSTSSGCGTTTSGFIKMQVRSGLTSDLSAVAFEGPDGNSTSSYMLDSTGSSIYSPDNTGTRYAQYQATFVSDSSCTAFLKSITFNYTK